MMEGIFKNRIYPVTKRLFNTRKIVHFFRLNYYRLFKTGRTFFFDGRNYHYFYHGYNTAWRTERSVEIPIVWDFVQAYQGKNILEVGNVLSHYYPVTHTVLDKYETAPGVLNRDVVDYHPGLPYDLIVAISTLEHVGWDEEPRDPPKVLRAIEHLKTCLAPGGRLIITIPMGQNVELDKYLRQHMIAFDRMLCMKRISKGNDWIETTWPEIQDAMYGSPFRAANGLVIGIIDKPA